MQNDKRNSKKNGINQIKSEIDWGSYPSGIISWVLYTVPRKFWPLVIWIIAIFITLSAVYAFYQISSIRGSQIEKHRADIFLEQWRRSDNPDWKSALLRNWSDPTDIPKEIWKEVVNHPDSIIRKAAAMSSYVPSPLVQKLYLDSNLSVRIPAILNRFDRNDIISYLADDYNVSIRILLAKSHMIPSKIQEKLANDKEIDVKRALAKNRSVSADIFRTLVKNNFVDIWKLVAENPSAPPELLKEMTTYLDFTSEFRGRLLRNPSTPIDTLRKFSSHPGYDFRSP